MYSGARLPPPLLCSIRQGVAYPLRRATITLRRSFPPVHSLQQTDPSDHPPLSLLPFRHPFFAGSWPPSPSRRRRRTRTTKSPPHISNSIPSTAIPGIGTSTSVPSCPRILVALGGSDSAGPMTEWQRKKQPRSEQRFMSKRQWQAETLTAALGTPLQQMVIPSAAPAKRSRSRAATPASRAEVRAYPKWTL